MSDEKKQLDPAKQMNINQLPNNHHEVYKAYLATMMATLGIILLSFLTYYFPMYYIAKAALQILNDTDIPLLGNVTI